MKKFFAAVLCLSLFGPLASASENNHGVLFSNPVSENKEHQPGERVLGGVIQPGSFADRHAWRSGIAGTFSMWGSLLQRAMPSNEGFPDKKKKK